MQRRAQCRSKIQIDAIRRTLEWFDKYLKNKAD